MINFDIEIFNRVKEMEGFYYRYSDDIIIVCPQNRINDVEKLLKKQIKIINLEIEETKTEIKYFKKIKKQLICIDKEGKKSKLQYLGVEFDGTLNLLRQKGHAKFERKMIKAIASESINARKREVSIAKRKLYEKFTTFGKKNYLTYVKRAAKELNSESIKKTIKPNRILKKINKKISNYK